MTPSAPPAKVTKPPVDKGSDIGSDLSSDLQLDSVDPDHEMSEESDKPGTS